MKRKPFILFEIIIALPLVALLLSFLVQSFSFMLSKNHLLEQRYEIALERHYFQKRFQQILGRADKKKQKAPFFKERSLEFDFDNGLSLYEKASGKLHAHFFYDENQKELALDLFKGHENIRHEILLTHVDAVWLEYLFEHKNAEANERNPFVISKDPLIDPQKWVALQAKVLRFDKEEHYFFLLKRSLSPSH